MREEEVGGMGEREGLTGRGKRRVVEELGRSTCGEEGITRQVRNKLLSVIERVRRARRSCFCSSIICG